MCLTAKTTPAPAAARQTVAASDQTPQAAIAALSLRLAPLAGRDFIDAFTRGAAEACGADFCLVARLNPYSNIMRSIRLVKDGRVGANIAYSLDGAPCERAMEADFCIHPENVAESFPRDQFLKENGISGYAGAAMRAADGRPVGVIAALSRGVFRHADKARAVFLRFRDRLAQEIDAVEALERYRIAADDGAIGVFDWDLLTGDTFISKSVLAMLGYKDDGRGGDLGLIEQAMREEDREAKNAALSRHMKEGAPFDILVRLNCRRGGHRWCRLRASALRDEAGAPIRMVGTICDVHDLIGGGPAPSSD